MQLAANLKTNKQKENPVYFKNRFKKGECIDNGIVSTKYHLETQGWTELRLFEEAEKFFMSVGLYEMFENFWNNSMLVNPNDGRQVVCHPTAWDMGNREDFR